MAFKQRMVQRQLQKMIMTVKMQQSMHILQLPILDLNQLISQEISNNPVLDDASIVDSDTYSSTAAKQKEYPETDLKDQPTTNPETNPLPVDKQLKNLEPSWEKDDDIWISNFVDKNKRSFDKEKYEFQQTLLTKSSTLQDDLLQQYRIINDNPDNLKIAEQIIGDIDENGYLSICLEEIAQLTNSSSSQVEAVLTQIQNLDPPGVGARNLKECLLIQLKRKNKENSLEAKIVNCCLNELATKKYTKISKLLKIPLIKVKKCAKNISQLDPKPGQNFAATAPTIIPDIILEKTQDGYEVIINTKNIPALFISPIYKKLIKDKTCSPETLNYIKDKLNSAQNLIHGVYQRQQTLEKVARFIIEYQQGVIEKGITDIKPLTLKEVAEKLQLHPSTISRTVANKYIQTPFGTFPLKMFFSQAISSQEGDLSNQKIKANIDELIKTEPANKPLSDQKIDNILKQKGINISRRTVTKYRNALKIPPASLRRK